MTDLVERLRMTLGGIEPDAFRGDNLAIFLAAELEPSIESEELDDSGTWKQGALDACDKVLDAIHAHYAATLEAKDKELAALRERVKELEVDLSDWRDLYSVENVDRMSALARAETAKRERDHFKSKAHDYFGWYDEALRERDEAREALSNLLRYAESNECPHEETHRGGSIWTICNECGVKWADDRGGFIPYKEPSEISAARAITGGKA